MIIQVVQLRLLISISKPHKKIPLRHILLMPIMLDLFLIKGGMEVLGISTIRVKLMPNRLPTITIPLPEDTKPLCQNIAML
jgi:hypothetical protein